MCSYSATRGGARYRKLTEERSPRCASATDGYAATCLVLSLKGTRRDGLSGSRRSGKFFYKNPRQTLQPPLVREPLAESQLVN